MRSRVKGGTLAAGARFWVKLLLTAATYAIFCLFAFASQVSAADTDSRCAVPKAGCGFVEISGLYTYDASGVEAMYGLGAEIHGGLFLGKYVTFGAVAQYIRFFQLANIFPFGLRFGVQLPTGRWGSVGVQYSGGLFVGFQNSSFMPGFWHMPSATFLVNVGDSLGVGLRAQAKQNVIIFGGFWNYDVGPMVAWKF